MRKFAVLLSIFMFTYCNNVADSDSVVNSNYWYLGYSSSAYYGRATDPIHVITDSIKTLTRAWIYAGSNFGYSILCNYDDRASELEGHLYMEGDSISVPLYRVVLDDRTFFVSEKYGPITHYSPDSIATPIFGKPILFVAHSAYCMDDADSVAYIFRVNSHGTDFKLRIGTEYFKYSP